MSRSPPPCSPEQYIRAIVDYILKETPEQQAELLALVREKDGPDGLGRRVFDPTSAVSTWCCLKTRGIPRFSRASTKLWC